MNALSHTRTIYATANTLSHQGKPNNLPNNGTASDVAGIVSATIFKNTVNDSKIVTPVKKGSENKGKSYEYPYEKLYKYHTISTT